MMKSYFKILIGFLFFSLLLSSCKKGGTADEPEESIGSNTNKEVTLSKSTGLPGEAIELKFNFKLEQERYRAKFGPESIDILRLTDSTGILYIPAIASSDYFIDLQQLGKNIQAPFKILPYSFNTGENAIKDEIWNIVAGLFNDQSMFGNMRQKFEDDLKKMSKEDRNIYLHLYRNLIKQTLKDRELEKFSNFEVNDLAKLAIRENLNLQFLTPANSLTRLAVSNPKLSPDYEALFMKPAIEFSNIMKGIAVWVLGHLIVTEATTYASRIWGPIALIGGTTISIGGALFICGLVDNAMAAVNLLYNYIAIVFTEDLLDTKMQNSDSMFKSSSDIQEQKMDFKIGQGLEQNIAFNFYSFSIKMKDKTRSSLINSLVSAYERVLPSYKKFYAMGNAITSFFQIENTLAKPESLIPQSSNKAARGVRASQIRIENISNSAIQMSHTDGEQGIIFQATGIGTTGKVEFTFDLVFEQSQIGMLAKQRVRATYDDQMNPETLQIVRGNLQFGKPGVTLDSEIAVKLTDALGNPAIGNKVVWKVKDGSGKLQSAESTTDISGVAVNKWTLGSTNQQRVEASFRKADDTYMETTFNALWDLNGTWEASSIYFSEDHKNWKGDWLKQEFNRQKIDYFTMIVEDNNSYIFQDAMTFRDQDNNMKKYVQSTPRSTIYFDTWEQDILVNFQAMGGPGPAILKYLTPTRIQINFAALKGFNTRWHSSKSTIIPYWWNEQIILEKK
ncbi:Ig-like domain-containing protein [Sphingobacterium faecale]|uniref:Ig-like domain-containing protein n=1 Tax=Sphingobacterium faecale TaxID=2803775 RepID=A0ABS1R8X1_9SPHI|nr:Ig-like domain-containing protein [Sphingobacterium faecale]MBL1410437.1 Ig-like domain-containing protein [Sphingobacterium faecale]